MGKIETLIACIYVTALLTLFLLSSTDILNQDNHEEVYKVSVIIDKSDDTDYENFKMGMDKAAKKWNIDISFVTLYEDHLCDSQLELIQREVINGAQALVIAPVDHERLEQFLQSSSIEIPIIILKDKVNSDKVTSTLLIDSYQMGMDLGNCIIEEPENAHKSVITAVKSENLKTSENFYQGLTKVLEQCGSSVTEYQWNSKEDLIVELQDKQSIIIGMDPESLGVILAQTKERKKLRIYGNGYNLSFLKYLEEGEIQSFTYYDEYNMGYLCMELGIRVLQDKIVNSEYQIRGYCIRSKEIYRSEYEMLLFPIS